MARTGFFDALRRAASHAMYRAKHGEDAYARAAEAHARELSRRDFMRASATAAGLVSLPGMLAACGDSNKSGGGNGGSARIAVIGAGIAGLHCAYRLQQAGIAARIFEASDRVGGRMYSARGLFADNQLVELGGELIDTNHTALRGLVEELGLTLDDLLTPEPAGIRRDTWYFGGRVVPDAEIVAAFTPVAAKMAAAVAAAEADDAEFERIDNLSIIDWLEGEGMADPLIRDVLDVAYLGEYGLESDEQSVFNLMYLIDYDAPDPFRVFGDSDEKYHVHEGNDAVPTRLGEELDAQIETGMRLVAVRQDGSEYVLTFESGAATVEKRFDHVVFAAPFTTLRQVQWQVDGFEEKQKIINELGYGTNSKLMLGFDRRVWREDHDATGATITDNGVQFLWETSRGQDGASGILTNFTGGTLGVQIGEGTAEEQALAALPAIDEIFPGTQAAYVANSAVRFHWPSHPHTLGSYTCYRPGQWAFYELEGKRVGNLHFCGEHTSAEFQGFMEGGAETGGVVAAEIIAELGASLPASLTAGLSLALRMPQPHQRHHRRMGWQRRQQLRRQLERQLRSR